MPKWIDDLPPLMRPPHGRFYLEATGAEELAFMRDLREQQWKAEASATEFAKAHGAVAYWPPMSPSSAEKTATIYAFDDKPTHKAWKLLKTRVRDAHYKAVASKTPEGVELAQAMTRCAPFPDVSREIEHRLGAFTDIHFKYADGGYGTSGIGVWRVADMFYTPDRLFGVLTSPFNAVLHQEEQHPDAVITGSCWRDGKYVSDGDPRLWRPPEGWTLLSLAEAELALAEAKVAIERSKAA